MSPSVARLLRSFQLPLGAVTDAALVAYALWTIGANVAVAVGGGARTLVVAFAIVVLVTAGLLRRVAKHEPLRKAYVADLVDDPVAPRAALTSADAIGVLSVGGLTVVGWLLTRNAWVAWVGCALCALYALWRAARETFADGATGAAPLASAVPTTAERVALHLLALACAAFSLLVVRPRADDTFYLNMAVSVVDYPQQALLSLKNLHGPASDTLGVQRMFAPYRLHSFELLGGLISYVSGLDAARVVHLLLATVFSWLTPFAVARLMRLLVPRAWLLGVAVVIAFYMIEGTAARGYANHALVRMFNGKSALLTVAAPLICAYGLRYGARPSRIRLALLALSQVAAVGLSSTGLWLAPTLAMVSVAAGTPRLRDLWKRAAGSLLSSAYVLALAMWVFSQLGNNANDPAEVETRAESTESDTLAAVASPVPPLFGALAEAVPVVFGPERSAVAMLAAVWLAGLVAPSVLGLRFFSLFVAVVALGFGNPFLSKLIARDITGATTFQRIFWLLPVVVGVGACCGAIYTYARARFRAPASAALAFGAAAAFLALTTDRLVVSQENQARFEFPPALKLWSHARTEAIEVCRWAPAGQYALASQAVSLQLPTLHGCAYPIATFDRWLSAPDTEKLARNELVRLVDEREDIAIDKAAWFVGALERYDVDAVVLSRAAARNTRIKALIRLADYERVATIDWDQIFVRTRSATHSEYEAVARDVCKSVPLGHNVLAAFGVSAVLERLKCAPAIVGPTAVLKATGSEFDDLLTLERVVYMASEPPIESQKQIEASIARRDVTTVVLALPAKGNKWFKAMLALHGFRKVRGSKGYSILVRGPVPSATQAAVPADAPDTDQEP